MLLYSTVCTNNQIRIVDSLGLNATEGLVEVCTGGGWGTVCGTSFGSSDAQVVCRQLGIENTGKLSNQLYYVSMVDKFHLSHAKCIFI